MVEDKPSQKEMPQNVPQEKEVIVFKGHEATEFRQQKVFELKSKGMSDLEISRILKCDRKTVYRDRKALSHKFADKFAEFNVKKIMEDVISKYETQEREAWSEMKDAKSPHAKARFLELIHNISRSQVDLFDKFGVFAQVKSTEVNEQDLNEFNKAYTMLMSKRKEEMTNGKRSPTIPIANHG